MISRRGGGLLLAALLMTLAPSCSSGYGGSGSSGAVTVTMVEKHGDISADSDLVKAHAGQPIEFKVTSDAPDEISVHSLPERIFRVKAGPQQTFTFSISTPGTVEVESDGLDATILKLEIL